MVFPGAGWPTPTTGIDSLDEIPMLAYLGAARHWCAVRVARVIAAQASRNLLGRLAQQLLEQIPVRTDKGFDWDHGRFNLRTGGHGFVPPWQG